MVAEMRRNESLLTARRGSYWAVIVGRTGFFMLAKSILVAEDDSNAVLLLKTVCSKAHIDAPLHVVRDGQEAIEYLEGSGEFTDRVAHPLPALLLLDLNMPRLNGFEVLKWIRQHPQLKRLLVVVLSSSADPKDVERSYDLGANSYLVKPMGFDGFSEMIGTLKKYWLEMNQGC